MPEPMDSIRRVNNPAPMTLDELYWARRILDKHQASGVTGVREARQRVDTMIDGHVASHGTRPGVNSSVVPATANKPEKQHGNPAVGGIVALVIGCVVFASCQNGDSRSDEDGFLDTVREESSSFSGIPNSTLLDSGNLVCEADEADLEGNTINGSFIDNGLTPSETGALVYAAREHLC